MYLRLANANFLASRALDHQVAHDAPDPAGGNRRRQQRPAAHDEQIAGGATHEVSLLIRHQPLGDSRVGPLPPRDHLLQAVQRFHAGQRGISRHDVATQPGAHAEAIIFGPQRRPVEQPG